MPQEIQIDSKTEWVRNNQALKRLYRREYLTPYSPPRMPGLGGIVNEVAALTYVSAVGVDLLTKNDYIGVLFHAAAAGLFVRSTIREVATYAQEYFNP